MAAVGKHDSGIDVLVITRNLPPLVGGMERLLLHVVKELSAGFKVAVIGPAGCSPSLPSATRTVEISVRPLWKFLVFSLFRASALSFKSRPRLFFAGSGLTAPMTWLLARILGGRCAVYLHGLDMIAPSTIYRCVWLPMIRRHDLCIVNSRYSRSLALSVGVPDEAISILHPGVAIPAETRGSEHDFKESLGIAGSRMLLYVGRLTPRKGLLEFIQGALPQLLSEDAGLKLVVIGDEPADAIGSSDPGYKLRLEEAADRFGASSAVRYLGACSDEMLSTAYAAADVLIFPVVDRPGDAEGFGMVAIEAAAHGTPTVAFAVGGVSDAVRDAVSGFLVKPGDYDALVCAIQRVIRDHGNETAHDNCRAFAASFEWEAFGARLRKMAAGVMFAEQEGDSR